MIRKNSDTLVGPTAQSNAEMRRGLFLYGLLAFLLEATSHFSRQLVVLMAMKPIVS